MNSFEPEFEALPFFGKEAGLKEKTAELKERLKRGETLDNILPEAFALVREAAKRTLGQRHFDCQLIGGIVLHQGKIAQMVTGEGKTLAATLALYLNALEGKGAHLVTVNDYLARRDTVWMGQIYHALGLTVGCLNHEQSFLYEPDYKKPAEEKEKMRDELGSFYVVEDFLKPCLRQEAYFADITYGTNNEFGFDYLRDNMVYDLNQQVQRGLKFVIVDEVDSILIDEARTPLIISAPETESSKWYKEFAQIIPKLNPKTDYEIDEKMRAVTLTEDGINKIEKILGAGNIYEEKGIKYLHHLEQALRAQAINPATGLPLFARDRDYVVKDGKVVIVDQFTGRLMPGRRWSGGLHQAIEAKERVMVQPESMTLATITFQNYFRMYEKLAGMTGTAETSAEEFDKVYGEEVILVPTNKPLIRENLPDKVYKSESGKFKAVVEEIKKGHKSGRPMLVGTTSIEKNEYLGRLLQREGIPCQILNAKHHEKEGEIIAQAGRLGAVTIATNMAGRGVDIILGGNPSEPKEAQKIKELGGFYVIGTERHEARRIDNQLRGRAGRQGDPGSSQFFVSLDEDLMRVFGGERLKSLMERFKFPEDFPIENKIITQSIESAQSKVEGMNFDARKHLLEYDDVLNKHREVFYKKRRAIIEAKSEERKAKILEIVKKQGYSEEDYIKKEKEAGPENMRQVEKVFSLRILDMLWIEHLENMESLRDSVKLRAYGQRDPLVEYKNEGHKMFQRLLKTFEENLAHAIFKVQLKTAEPAHSDTTDFSQSSQYQSTTSISSHPLKSKPGRNDPCPCGKINPRTGKPMKYKKCCWPKYG
ncbi:MAG: preprotein translocase subunit SecA [Candidatus Nealsonbacteria bacterium CG11_big_fil_rev_8_21_14_0_20_35_11]|uniref:Protein translocase subunit SecA n=1 Tax=Candidatus Nealsonbacteria bacterium CG11_big_fil_rev_8_21_14_0_20_35_11 TaxID=1974713 RepID=A0A2H0N0M2_9BACT|nr:MAG: preprotein translocase subunit SecA [Candidatus Nealsonbacteria bacterium CG11_big_fil_rev_8_21_14_0_20_35_11]